MEKKIVSFVVCALMFWLGWKLGYELEHARRPEFTERTDTTFVYDTIVRDSLVPIEVERWKTVTEYLPVHDTTIVRDSVLVDIPIERRVYQEDSVYYAVVTGYHPSLDTLKVYRETVTIETTRNVTSYKPYKWAVSPFVSQEVGLDYYDAKVGVQAEFGRNRWRFVPEIGYRASSLEEHGWYAGGRLKFDLIRKK